MLFNSYSFLIFLLITFSLYYLPFAFIRKMQLSILIIASFIFYAYERPVLLLLLLGSISINTLLSYLIYRSEKHRVKPIVVFGVVFNLAIIAFFKYSPLIASSFNNELNIKNGFTSFLLTIPLPIGISFYTFEGISLLLDLYKDKNIIKENTFAEHFSKTAIFISFFPHLIAGPILKARDFYPQINTKYFKDISWEVAIKKIILGFFLKMVVADNLSEITANIQFPYFQAYSSGNLILYLLGYSMQIFADFAGYSLIAIGVGLLFGYRLPKNFNFPYISSSFSEFWRRWHISLSTWLRDYLYFPLGGNRKGNLRTYFNLFVVMFLGGLWHGAAWSYAVWGAMHGFFLMVERFFTGSKAVDTQKRNYLGMIYVFTIVTILWLLFKLTDFSIFLLYIKDIFINTHIKFKIATDEISILFYTFIIALYHFAYLVKEDRPDSQRYMRYDTLAYGIMLFLTFVNSGSAGAFIYFQF
jgi:alginate O-acetyltransferase complex protein AlgI